MKQYKKITEIIDNGSLNPQSFVRYETLDDLGRQVSFNEDEDNSFYKDMLKEVQEGTSEIVE